MNQIGLREGQHQYNLDNVQKLHFCQLMPVKSQLAVGSSDNSVRFLFLLLLPFSNRCLSTAFALLCSTGPAR